METRVTELIARERSTSFPFEGANIVCFAKDWQEDPTSNNHLMIELAKHNRVLWLNSISMRTPRVSRRDLGKVGRKLLEFLKGPFKAKNNLYVYTPIALPFPHSHLASVVNRWILKVTLRILRRKLGMKDFQLWTFLPNVIEYIGHLGESLVVYYCVDEWSQIPYINGEAMADAEAELCRRADIVFATAESLVERRKAFNPETHLASHGVDHLHFATALDDSLSAPHELSTLPKPVLGFYGLIHDWIDLNLIAYLAERHPNWSIVMIGSCRVDTSQLKGVDNIHFLGRRAYADLPRYCKAFAVGLIPFRLNELTPHINPIKLREYLSAGLPVVSTDLPEVRHYYRHCVVATTYEDFEAGIVKFLSEDSPRMRKQRSDTLRSETWEQKATEVAARVRRVSDRKGIGVDPHSKGISKDSKVMESC